MATCTFSNLTALNINGKLWQAPHKSNGQSRMAVSTKPVRNEGVNVESLQLIDHHIPHEMECDLSVYRYARHEMAGIFTKVFKADILVAETAIRFGAICRMTKKLIDRLDPKTGERNGRDQNIYYGKLAGCIERGNENGARSFPAHVICAMQHIGFTIRPKATTAWLGKVSLDTNSKGDEADTTRHELNNKNTTITTYNLRHLSSFLKGVKGFSMEGNDSEAWADGERRAFDKPQFTT